MSAISTPAASAAAVLTAVCGAGGGTGGGIGAAGPVSALGSALFATAARDAAATNLIVSPLSVYLALTLALNAAGTGSQTQAEFLRALCAASQAGKSGYALLAPGGGLPAADAAKAEAALNADIAALSRALTAPPAAAAAGGGNGTKSAATGSSSPPPPGGKAKNATAAAASPAAAAAPAQATGPELLLANSLWTQKGPAGANISADYASRMSALLNAVAKQGDAADVNAWASKATKGLIEQAVAPGTRFDLLLANAVYFKGQWERAFDKADTIADADFSALKVVAAPAAAPAAAAAAAADKKQPPPPQQQQPQLAFAPKKVQMMAMRFKAADDRAAMRAGTRTPLVMIEPKFVAARLPYRGDRQSAVLVLPTDKAPGALQALLQTGGAGGERLDWRRDLGLEGPVPESWAPAIANATGLSVEELTRFGRGGQAMPPPPPRPPVDPGDRLVELPRAAPSLPSAMPTLPADSPWLPSSTRSNGGLVVRMPKFRAETKQLSLRRALSDPKGLAVAAAFDASAANFSRATQGGDADRLAVDDVIHSAVVIVDEEGTEAAAVTAVVMLRAAMPMGPPEDPPIEIILDRPFLFAVVDDATGTPMFVGSVTDPVWTDKGGAL